MSNMVCHHIVSVSLQKFHINLIQDNLFIQTIADLCKHISFKAIFLTLCISEYKEMLTIKHIPILLKFKSCYVLQIRNRDVASFLKEGECWGSDSSKMKILQPPPPQKNPQKITKRTKVCKSWNPNPWECGNEGLVKVKPKLFFTINFLCFSLMFYRSQKQGGEGGGAQWLINP